MCRYLRLDPFQLAFKLFVRTNVRRNLTAFFLYVYSRWGLNNHSKLTLTVSLIRTASEKENGNLVLNPVARRRRYEYKALPGRRRPFH